MNRVDTLRKPKSQGIDLSATRSFTMQDILASYQAPLLAPNRPLTPGPGQEAPRVRKIGPVPIYERRPQEQYQAAKEKLSPASSTRDYIAFFNRFHKEEGLTKDWQKLQYGDTQVGFSIDKQMKLLREHTPELRKEWALQTYRDLQGYLIEYVSPYIVYPWKHERRVTADGTAHLVDTRYGGRRMVDTVTDEERNGAVKSVLEVIDQAVVSGKVPDGSMFLQISPQDTSETGLTMDNGTPIVYKDTHLMFSQVKGNKLEGFTLKTDFTQAECRELIRRLTGKIISDDAPIEDYIRAFAFIDPNKSNLKNLNDLVGVAADVRSDMSFGSKNAFKEKTWDQVREQISLEDRLYDWTETSQAILKQFIQDVMDDSPNEEELPHYMAATILRAVQAAQMDQLAEAATQTATQQLQYILPPSHFDNFGDILKAAAAITGCAGGGPAASSMGALGGINRSVQKGGVNTESCPKISCPNPDCEWEANAAEVASIQAKVITRCPRCGASPEGGGSRKEEKEEEPASKHPRDMAALN